MESAFHCRARLWLGSAVLLALTVLTWSGAEPASAQQPVVMITAYDDVLVPVDVTIPVGTMVIWLNAGHGSQTMTSPGIWDSGPLGPGQSWAAIFAVEGTFEYQNRGHAVDQRGRIVVSARRP